MRKLPDVDLILLKSLQRDLREHAHRRAPFFYALELTMLIAPADKRLAVARYASRPECRHAFLPAQLGCGPELLQHVALDAFRQPARVA
jgi:hypothetical protein